MACHLVASPDWLVSSITDLHLQEAKEVEELVSIRSRLTVADKQTAFLSDTSVRSDVVQTEAAMSQCPRRRKLVQRRLQLLEELVDTERSYVDDLETVRRGSGGHVYTSEIS